MHGDNPNYSGITGGSSGQDAGGPLGFRLTDYPIPRSSIRFEMFIRPLGAHPAAFGSVIARAQPGEHEWPIQRFVQLSLSSKG